MESSPVPAGQGGLQVTINGLPCVAPDTPAIPHPHTPPYVVIVIIVVVITPGLSIEDRLAMLAALTPVLIMALRVKA